MKSSIYDYLDYKAYILDLITNSPDGKRGKRKQLAEFIGCQFSHITGVLGGDSHFSLEQAEAASRFFGLSNAEAEHILLLVQYGRAGSLDLKDFLESLIEKAKDEFNRVNKLVDISKSLKKEEQTQYYQSWLYSAVNTLVSVPEFQTRESISKKLNEPQEKIDKVLDFLIKTGLVKKEEQKFIITNKSLHLDKFSPLIVNHHTNWRLRTLKEFELNKKENLHYSSSITFSKTDYKKIKELLSKALSNSIKVVQDSKEEDIGVLCLDLYKL